MQYAILQKWQGEDTFTLLLQVPENKETECKGMLERLRKEAYKKKQPVEYKMVELDGFVETPNFTSNDEKERKIIIPSGTFKGAEVWLEREKYDH
jgi:hypothetical protein